MSSGDKSNSNKEAQDAYSRLGLEPGATFECIKIARDKKLEEVGEDPIAKAQIEASYDELLMQSLKDRQLGKTSNAAVKASKTEELDDSNQSSITNSLFDKLGISNFNKNVEFKSNSIQNISVLNNQGLLYRISIGVFAVFLAFASSGGAAGLIISLLTISLYLSLLKRGRKPLPSIGLSLLILSIGITAGTLITMSTVNSIGSENFYSKDLLETVPTIIIIWLGIIFLE
tara:strand:+ start:21751 stop:22440 length:690 start_codon:yes stop_codon:yes gene_type:complete